MPRPSSANTSRRLLARLRSCLLAGLGGIFVLGTGSLPAAERPNVLMIAIDDLNTWVGCLGGHPQAKTPNIDRLAASGTLFTNAHCQAPLCNPSRASIMTGLRPSSTGVYGLAPGIRDVEKLKDHVTLPQTFRRAGYSTFTCGKIYHDGSIPKPWQPGEFDVWGPAPGMPRPPKKLVAAKLPHPHPLVDWGVYPEDDTEQADWKIADAAIGALRDAPKDKPFFVACGFRLPHLPCYASKKWFDMFPPESEIVLPPVLENDRDDIPRFAGYLHWVLPEPRLKWLKENNQWRSLARSYLASTTFMDSQLGRVLDALKATGRADNTIVVLWSDNGWHLGEKGMTAKTSLWNESTRLPLIFSGPGIASGAKCSQPAELLDMFPTLIDLCRFEPRKDLEGHSLLPQLKDAKAARPWPAITTHCQGNHSIRNERWRYTRFADGSEELYDEQADPHEWKNLANDPAQAAIKRELAGWLPKVDLPPALGSKSRLVEYDPKTKQAVWEGKPIDPNESLPD